MEHTALRESSTNILEGQIKPSAVHINMRGYILQVNSKKLRSYVINSILVHHFVDSDLRIKIFFEKDGAAKKRGIDFEIGNIDTSAYLYWDIKKVSFRTISAF